MTTSKTPNLDRVRPVFSSLAMETGGVDDPPDCWQIDDVRAAVPLDIAEAERAATVDAFDMMRVEAEKRAHRAVTDGFRVACREFAKWATEQRDAVQAAPDVGPKPGT